MGVEIFSGVEMDSGVLYSSLMPAAIYEKGPSITSRRLACYQVASSMQ